MTQHATQDSVNSHAISLTVSGLANSLNIPVDTIRHYVRIGLLKPFKDPNNGYKRFSKKDQLRLIFIVQAKQLGFSLQDIQTILHQAEEGQSPCPTVRSIIEDRMIEVAQKITAMQAMYQQMQDAMTKWQHQPDCMPTGDHICRLIEDFSNQSGDRCHE
jgi:DNA-binding transcriptional MerR regulator